MIRISQLQLEWYQIVVLVLIGLFVFGFTYWLYPYIISWMKRKKYVGYDIHKQSRPETAESGGIAFSISITFGLIMLGFIIPTLWHEVFIFIITILIATVVGWIDDRKQLSSLRKIILMFVTGLPVFIANLPFLGFIKISNPILPILGRLQLTIIYPLTIPIIIMVMTNTVNMLEGYNGEGSGTTSIALVFMILASFLLGSSQGLIYGYICLAGIGAFYFFNKYPAKIFPGDTGTLVIGASIALVGIFGSIETIMILVMLPQIFNSFYVIASVRGFKESHTIDKKDILLDSNDLIHASEESTAPLTLPRLLTASGPLSEKELVNHIFGLSTIAGIISLIVALTMMPFFGPYDAFKILGVISISLLTFLLVISLFPKILGLSVIMVVLVLIALGFLWIIDQYIIDKPVNWLFGILIGGVILILWYLITLIYFRHTLRQNKIKKQN
ncbi:MAG: hypothetical protein DRO88_01135 [Promethearchaeia archaeon]|nr:MAG: hypothetical protein DRO88_01135 [Candidatus Lokiarchaeia archaeon]